MFPSVRPGASPFLLTEPLGSGRSPFNASERSQIIARLAGPAQRPAEIGRLTRSLAIVGAGFSGTLLALHALRRAPPGTRVLLIERSRRFGQGLAYGSGNPNHLLNVPAARMSAFHDRPADFLQWLHEHPPWQDCTGQCFVPRQAFGAYVRDLLKTELRRPGTTNRLVLVRGEVQGIRPLRGELAIQLDRDRLLSADLAVLATGNFPPETLRIDDPGFYDGAFYRADPWEPGALDGLDPAAPVLLIGTGLTALDTVISLLDRGHAGPITAISRRGLLPLRHAEGPASPRNAVQSLPTDVLQLLRFVRKAARQAVAGGGSWQSAVDALRPFTPDIWQAMQPRDRARFLRHLRPWWDVHRHRMAPLVADRIANARASGQLRIRVGRIQACRPDPAGSLEVRFRLRPRDGGGEEAVVVGRVINCSGPSCGYERTKDPLLRVLLDTGLARPDPLRLGLDVTGTCALREASGAVSCQLFAVGPITKAMFWEMTAVPDLRRQCEALATHLASLLGALPPRPPDSRGP